MTRTIFIVTVFISMMIFSSKKDSFFRLAVIGSLVGYAFLMGLTRVYLGEHWISDVIGGTMLGAGMGFLAAVLILRKDKDKIAADAQRR